MSSGAARPRLILRLYVAGDSPNSARSLTNLEAICARHRENGVDIDVEVVDVWKEPLRPMQDGVLVTPTLVRVSPGPACRIIGDLGDTATVLHALGLAGGRWREGSG